MRTLTVLLGGLLLFAAACGGDDSAAPAVSQPSPPSATQVERQMLGSAATERAPGQSLELSRVVIPAGQAIAKHTHPGPQLAVIASGVLTYSVVDGQVSVTRFAGSALSASEVVGAGQTVELQSGDALLETPGMVHTARNAGQIPVVVYLSSLFPEGAPPASPVE